MDYDVSFNLQFVKLFTFVDYNKLLGKIKLVNDSYVGTY